MKTPELITQLVKLNIPVTLEMFDDDNIGFNINTETKSQAVLVYDEEKNNFKAYMRYNQTEENIENLDDVLMVVKDCMHGRPFVADHWLKLLVEHGYLTIKEEVKRTIEF